MRRPLLLISLSLTVLLTADVLAQNPVGIQFQTDPVLVQTGTDIVFTVLIVPQVLSITWQYQGGVTLGLWAGGASVVNPVQQFSGRVTITATQLRIVTAQLQDAGNYTVSVIPTGTTLAPNSRSIQLSVFDAVAGVTLVVPSVAVEGGNVSLSCTWTAGTGITVQWGKNGVAITASSRITISGGSLVINPAQRGDNGTYTCTVSNPVSAQTASQTLTVYYGPDTPVLTKQTPKACVGGGDVLVGQTVGLTCTSNSLPPALFTWQYNGQPVTSSQSSSGVLTLQTYSTNQSGQYVCTARNSITGNTSTQGTALAIVGVCLSVGEVVGIVIGSLLLIIIIVLLIVLIVFFAQRRWAPHRERNTVVVQKTNPQITPPDPQPNGARELGQGLNPPLYHRNTHTRRLYTAPSESRGNLQALPQNGLRNSDTHQHNGRTHTNELLPNAIQDTNSYPHNGIDNPAFMHTESHNANPLSNTQQQQQQHPNILIQTGAPLGGAQPSAVHVNLNTLPQTAQQNNNAQIPTIHVNLTSYPANGLQTQQDSSFPLTNADNNHATQTQLNLINAQQSNPREQSGQSYPRDPGYQRQPGLIPTGYTHYNSNNTSQRNANTQTYQQEPHRDRSDRTTGRHDATPSSSRRQMSWDLLRGTPSYPSGSLQRGQISPEATSDATDYTTTDSTTTDYTTHPPIREPRMPHRSQPQPRSQTTSRSRATTRQDAPSVDRQTLARSADLLSPNTRSATQLEAANRTQRNHRTQRESTQQDISGLLGRQTAPRQEATHRNNPQALPLMSQQASVGRSAVSQGLSTQQGLTSTWGTDTRALADPNHLPQAHVAQQHRAASIQAPPQGLGTRTQPDIHGTSHTRQGGTAPIPQTSTEPNPSNLTQAALKAHTERAQTFQNRKQQTQAALLHPGPQARTPVPVAGVHSPPTPPPAIPLEQFQTLPKQRTQHRSPTRGPQPSRHPLQSNVQHHPTMIAATHHHHPGRGHMHVSANRHAHDSGHKHHAHPSHPQQQQAHRGRPR